MVVHYLACGSCPAYSLETFGECVYPQKFWLRGMGSGHVSASVCIFLVLGMMSPVCGYDENHVPHLEGTCSSWAALRSYQCQDTAFPPPPLQAPWGQDLAAATSITLLVDTSSHLLCPPWHSLSLSTRRRGCTGSAPLGWAQTPRSSIISCAWKGQEQLLKCLALEWETFKE